MLRIFLILSLTMSGSAQAYVYDEYMPIAPRPTVPPMPISIPDNPDIPTNDIKPYEQTHDL